MEFVDRNDGDVKMKEMDAKSENNNPSIEENGKTDNRPLMARRILSEEDLRRLRELRVKNLMKMWNRTRDEVALKEEQDSDIEIDPDNIESLTTIRRQEKEKRALIGKNKHLNRNRLSWDEYCKQKGGGKTNAEQKRSKAFHMSKYATAVLQKQKRSYLGKRRSKKKNVDVIKSQGKNVKRRRR